MWCTNCGAQLIDGARFCDKCGAKLNIPPVIQQVNAAQAPSSPVQVQVNTPTSSNAVLSGQATRPLVQPKIVLPNLKQVEVKIEGTTTIGRQDPACHCDIDVTEVDQNLFSSRRHAEIIARFGEYYLKDVGSRNGTYVNNKKIGVNEEVKLKHQDRIIVGQVELVFLCE